MFAVHYNKNVPLPGVGAGEYNYDITEPTGTCLQFHMFQKLQCEIPIVLSKWKWITVSGDEWVHINEDVGLVEGDTVYYWFLVIHNGEGHQMTDLSWTVESGETLFLHPT